MFKQGRGLKKKKKLKKDEEEKKETKQKKKTKKKKRKTKKKKKQDMDRWIELFDYLEYFWRRVKLGIFVDVHISGG